MSEEFCYYPWDSDVEYARFVIKALRRGYFETKDEETKLNSSTHLSQREYEQRLAHLKRFYWSRVLNRPAPPNNYTQEFKSLLSGEADIVRKLVKERKHQTDVLSTEVITKSASSLISNLSGMPHGSEFRVLILALQFTILFDQLKKKYRHYISIQDQLTWKEKQKHLREIGVVSGKLTQISMTISKSIAKTQLNLLIDKSIAWAAKEKAKSLVSNATFQSPLTRLQHRIKQRILSEFSWFPHSRL